MAAPQSPAESALLNRLGVCILCGREGTEKRIYDVGAMCWDGEGCRRYTVAESERQMGQPIGVYLMARRHLDSQRGSPDEPPPNVA